MARGPKLGCLAYYRDGLDVDSVSVDAYMKLLQRRGQQYCHP